MRFLRSCAGDYTGLDDLFLVAYMRGHLMIRIQVN